MTHGCRHFEARQRLGAPECWDHLNPAVWPEICRARTKACKQVLARNNSRTKCNNLVTIRPWMAYNHISLSQKNHYKMKIIPIVSKKAWGELGRLTRVYVNSVLLTQVTSEHFTFLIPAFESSIHYGCTGNLDYFLISMHNMRYSLRLLL